MSPPEFQVQVIRPSGTGDSNDWNPGTPGNWDLVDEDPPDSSDKINVDALDGPNRRDLYVSDWSRKRTVTVDQFTLFASLSASAPTVGNPNGRVRMLLRVGNQPVLETTDVSLPPNPFGVYVERSFVLTGPFVIPAKTSIQIGIENMNASVSIFCRQMWARAQGNIAEARPRGPLTDQELGGLDN